MHTRSFVVLIALLGAVGAELSVSLPASAQGLPDPARAKAIDKCHIVLDRTGAKMAVKKLKSLAKCTNGVFKCVETKPGDGHCLDQARARCAEQLRAGAAAEATLIDVVVRKCGSDLTVADLLSPAGLDVESLRATCSSRFGLALDDLAAVGSCLARQHACELEGLLARSLPRAASLLAVAGVDPAARAELSCLTDFGGTDEHVSDPRVLGRPVERCARTISNVGLKLVESSLKGMGRCLETLFTCVQVKRDPAAAPACVRKAEQRCKLEIANLAAVATRPLPAIASGCGTIDVGDLRAASGLRLAALDTDCDALGSGAPTTLGVYAECLTRSHRCGVAALLRFISPRADALLATVGTSLDATLCPALAPTPTATPSIVSPSATPITTTPTATLGEPSATATTTPPAPTATAPTPSPTPGCADAYEPDAFPAAPASLDALCTGSCTDNGFDLVVAGTIDVAGDSDFYVVDVVDLPMHSFSLHARLSDVPHGTNYDLFLYRLEGGVYVPLDSSTNDGTGAEAVAYSANGDGESGRYGIEVRGIAGASCTAYRLDIENPN